MDKALFLKVACNDEDDLNSLLSYYRDRINDFEKELQSILTTQYAEVLNKIETEKELTKEITEQLEKAEQSRRIYQEQLTVAGYGVISTEIRVALPFYYAEEYHQQYLAKNPAGYCGLGGTGVSCSVAGLLEPRK